MFCNRPCDWNCMRQPTVKRIEVMAPLPNGELSTSAIVFLFASAFDGVLYVQAIQSGSEAVGAALPSDLRVNDHLHSRHFNLSDRQQFGIVSGRFQVLGAYPPEYGLAHPGHDVGQGFAVDQSIEWG